VKSRRDHDVVDPGPFGDERRSQPPGQFIDSQLPTIGRLVAI
jgi:hypothetical protein